MAGDGVLRPVVCDGDNMIPPAVELRIEPSTERGFGLEWYRTE